MTDKVRELTILERKAYRWRVRRGKRRRGDKRECWRGKPMDEGKGRRGERTEDSGITGHGGELGV